VEKLVEAGAPFIVGGGKTGALVRSIDWQGTLLGPAREWPQSFRTALSICLSSRFLIALYWGPDFFDALQRRSLACRPNAAG
jgi:hypothetical protein